MAKSFFTNKFWTNGYSYRKIISDTGYITAIPNQWYPTIEKRDYLSGLDDCFNVEDGWKPCTQDEFIAAYCEAINRISESSGIEHLPLQMEVHTKCGTLIIDNTSNPES